MHGAQAVEGQIVNMSRTDVHRPWDVQIRDPYNRPHLIRYGWRQEEVYLDFHTCGCWICTNRLSRRLEIRSQRVAWRNLRSELMKAVDKEEVDTHLDYLGRYCFYMRKAFYGQKIDGGGEHNEGS